MKRQDLHEKFSKLLVRLENRYCNSDLDITDTEYGRLRAWLESIAYVLKSEPVDFTDAKLAAFERTYNEAEREVFSRLALGA